ncbi:MAG: hypothetical protein HFG82_13835 [Dorea sp.]|jgi:hypothetical protein|nr:hypothetical protein [Dorea sp.]
MLRSLRRKIYKKIRFETWYRKAYYYHRKRNEMDEIIEKYRGPEVFQDRRYLRSLRRDMIRSLFKYGSYYSEYFLFGYEEEKSPEYRASFITEGIRMSFYPRMNLRKNTDLLENKYRTYKKFQDMFKREVIRIKKNEDPSEENLKNLKEFAARHENYVVKPVYAAFGTAVRIENIAMYESVEDAHARYRKNGVVIEELIEQGEAMARIHPGSVNTLRIPTVIIKNAEGEPDIQLFHPSLRMGRDGSFVDNFSAGGVSALIDPITGMIYTDGADKKGHSYECHPDSKIPFRGFQIPQWEEAVSMVKEAAMMIPDNHYCGWDLAYSKERGWCMVEANCTAQMGAMQMVEKKGRKHELEALIAQM